MIYVLFGFILLLVILMVYMYRLAAAERVLEHDLQFADFPPGFGRVSLYFISDIHKRKISRELIGKVAGKAELVIIGGDLAEAGVSMSRIEENIRMLQEIGPVYFVWGNNDYELDYHQLDATLLALGVKTLDNTAAIFESQNGDKLAILGVDYNEGGRARLDLALADAGDAAFKILVSHCPSMIRRVEAEHNISLFLSGHTHGGQIRLFGIGKYKLGGLTTEGNVKMLVSNGHGTSLIPFRLGAKPETHILHLMNDEASGS